MKADKGAKLQYMCGFGALGAVWDAPDTSAWTRVPYEPLVL